jgi:DUF971 family protein
VGVPLLGEIPLDGEVVEAGDQGIPIVVKNPASPPAQAYFAIARNVISQLEGGNVVSFYPLEVKRLNDRQLEIVWSDGHQSVYSFHHLRENCPCALCVDEWTRERRIAPGGIRPDVQPMDFHPVGRYAIAFRWSDGHATGIYTFDRLRELCQCAQCLN